MTDYFRNVPTIYPAFDAQVSPSSLGIAASVRQIDISLLSGVQFASSFENPADRAEDRSSNGLDWEVGFSGGERFATPGGGKLGYSMVATTTVSRTTHDAVLAITGAMAMHMLYWPVDSIDGEIAGFGSPGPDVEVDNFLYQLQVSTGKYNYFAEFGAGNNTGGDFGVRVPVGGWQLLSLLREAGGDATLYMNGIQAGPTIVATTPTGGGNSTLFLRNSGSVTRYQGDLVIQNVEPTPAQVLAIAQQVGVVGGGAPQPLAYKVGQDVDESIIIRGANLARITVVDVATDVRAGGNSGSAPTVGALVVTDTSITVPLTHSGTAAGDVWGVALRDAAGNSYLAPSPLQVYSAA